MLFCQMAYRDTRAYILDPCIQEFLAIDGCLLTQEEILTILHTKGIWYQSRAYYFRLKI